jgi:hypothetical protein
MRILIVSLICAFLAGCGPEAGPEEALRAWVDAAEAAAEEKDRRGLLALISENYADARGNDHEQIGNMLRYYFLRQKSVAFITNGSQSDSGNGGYGCRRDRCPGRRI